MRAHRPVHNFSHLSCSLRIVSHYTLHCVTMSPLSRGVWHCITHYITHTQTSLCHSSVTGNMTCHDTGWQFHKITECTVYSTGLPVSGLISPPTVHLYSYRQTQVPLGPLTPGSVSSGQQRMIQVCHQTWSEETMLQCYKTQTISHHMLNREDKKCCVVTE